MTIIVRSLALGQIDLKDFWAVFRHELGVGTLHGLVLGALVAAIIFVWLGNPILSAVDRHRDAGELPGGGGGGRSRPHDPAPGSASTLPSAQK